MLVIKRFGLVVGGTGVRCDVLDYRCHRRGYLIPGIAGRSSADGIRRHSSPDIVARVVWSDWLYRRHHCSGDLQSGCSAGGWHPYRDRARRSHIVDLSGAVLFVCPFVAAAFRVACLRRRLMVLMHLPSPQTLLPTGEGCSPFGRRGQGDEDLPIRHDIKDWLCIALLGVNIW
ncbi:MAG: hypothetical protein KatS3mg022_1037 [Armatimonadota bacterium]|nr:MAG: hypothetical protein KatS3mg022_1037 [Armatimonadota bacterium]